MRRRRMLGSLTAVALIGVALTVAPATPASAATITVTTVLDVVDGDDGVTSLREAISAASANIGDDEIVLGSGESYELSLCGDPSGSDDDVNLTDDLDHTDPSGAIEIVGDGSIVEQTCPYERVLHQHGVGILTLSGVTITGGSPGDYGTGGGVFAWGSVVMEGARIVNNRIGLYELDLDEGFGGGLVVSGDLTMTDSEISDNVASAQVGGGLGGGAAVGGNVSLLRSHIDRNEVGDSGGGLLLFDDDATLTLVESTISDNVAAYGAAIISGGDIDLQSSTVEGNTTTLGPVLYADELAASGSTLSHNTSGFQSAFAAQHVMLSESIVEDNIAPAIFFAGNDTTQPSSLAITGGEMSSNGGGPLIVSSSATLTGVDVRTNHSGDQPLIDASHLTISGSSLASNLADVAAPMVPLVLVEPETVGGSASATIVDTEFSENEVGGLLIEGRAPDPDDVELSITNSEISTDVMHDQSGDAGVGSDGTLHLVDSFVFGMHTSGAFGGVRAGGDLTVEHSVIQGSSGAGAAGVMAEGSATITDSMIWLSTSHAAGGHAGLIATDPTAEIHIARSSIVSNLSEGAASVAGVQAPVGSSLVLTTSMISENEAPFAGIQGGHLSLEFVTLDRNHATAGAALEAESLVTMASALGAVGVPVCAVSGEVVSRGFNVVSDSSCPLTGGTDHVGAGDLGTGDGLAPDSPLIGAIPASNPACTGEDLFGTPRPQGFGCEAGAVEVGAPTFSDVPPPHPFFVEIECLVALGVTEGFPDGTFRPTLEITRQAVVAWLWRLAGEPAPSAPPSFSDVPADHPFADAIAWAAEEGIAEGYPDGTFRPGASVTRQAVAAWLHRLAGEPTPGAGAPTFSDVGPSHPFGDAIEWLAGEEITTGFDDGTFRPTSEITRMALAAWVCRYEAADLAAS